MASAKSFTKGVVLWNVSACRQLAQWPALLVAGLSSAYLASHDILETAGWKPGYLIWNVGVVLC